MYIVKDTDPAAPYTLTFVVVDAEGNPVPDADVVVDVTSDNTDVLTVERDPTDPLRGLVRFPNYGLAGFIVKVSLADGTVLGTFGAQFTVNASRPANITDSVVVFEGLTES